MWKLDVKSKQNSRLQQRTLADGCKSLYLESYYQRREYYKEALGRRVVKHDRHKAFLNLYTPESLLSMCAGIESYYP